MRILVVEDEPSLREGLVDLLSHHGYEVDAAVDGESAVRVGL
ncbi:DNA-binding response regulator, partial [bacterium]